ncbi:regulatory protein RecX [Psychrobacter sp. NG27]|uniref:regulatory protein RecX n=1 Tax=Psychrobacter sp. NG27 TaxID=2781966 RepID=UPI0018E04998|nr:regulatory protein RecX [Psychrobacter sp. NG27]MBI0426717.1 regulatory protein RecX [Psychrobacter sp. NG27]
MEIKTLAEILAESASDSASNADAKSKKIYKHTSKQTRKTGKRFIPSGKSHSEISRSETTTLKISSSVHNKPANSHSLHSDSAISESISDIEAIDSLSSANPKIARPKKRQKREKRFHPAANFIPEPSDVPAYEQPKAQSIKEMLAEVKHNVHRDEDSSSTAADDDTEHYTAVSELTSAPMMSNDHEQNNQTDNIPAALKAYLRTPEQRQAEVDAIKAESRLRWLAFYYLSRREYGKAELKQKLIDKEQDLDKVDALLDEFEEKGYQSDYRTTLMLIRENIRKGRGRGRIKQEFYRKKIAMPSNVDELIDMANAESDEFSEFVDDSADNLVDGVDWLKLAVVARTRKYGDDIPVEQKDKARQLRFLQYRGFNTDICFAALNYTSETLDERF